MEASVVIPTYNKAAYLELTLESLWHQSCATSQYEVIVVDDGSSDTTSAVLECFRERGWHFQAIKQAQAGRSVARNVGILAATGRIVLFLDDDCLCDRELVATHIARHAGADNKVVMGWSYDAFTHIPINREQYRQDLKRLLADMGYPVAGQPAVLQAIERAVAALPDAFNIISAADIAGDQHKRDKLSPLALPALKPDDSSYFERVAQSRCVCPWVLLIRNASVNRGMLLQVGLFDESFQGWGDEDQELSYRLFRAGASFDAALEAVVYHQIHPFNREAKQKEWIRNYIHFAEKYRAPEIYLRSQYMEQWFEQQSFSRDEYERTVAQIEGGLLSEAELQAIKDHYDRFVANYRALEQETQHSINSR
jgi:glycosyltransferase involved in cell wall biosynthesis